MKFEVLHPAEDVERRGPDPKQELPDDRDELHRQLQSAVDAAGRDDVDQAIEEVVTGQAKPEALMWWIDDLRDPERHEQPDKLADLQEGVVPDFIADTEFAGGALDVHDELADDNAVFFAGSGEQSQVPDSDADADYFFSVIRKRQRGDGDDEDSPDEGDGGKTPDQPKPKTKTKTKTKLRR